MGALHSKSLSEITKEAVGECVQALGPEYNDYAELVDDNGIDGDLLSEMNQSMFLETLEDLEITNPVHIERLLEEFQSYVNLRNAVDQHPDVRGGTASSSLVSPLETQETRNVRDPSQLPRTTANGQHPQPHLGPHFYDKIDKTNAPFRPPIAKDDMDRVAQVESYRLEEIEPDSDIAQKLEGLVQMAMNLCDFDLGDITFLNHECQYSMARVGLTKPMERAIIDKVYQVINYTEDSKPFLCKTDRSIGICNYPTYSRRTFVVPDIEQDIAFQWMRVVWPFRCYMGAPLLTASGVVIGTLCMHNLDPITDLDRGCETQLEQVANMVVQSIENWKLRRNISRLETTRLQLQTTNNKSKPPKDKAVVVFTGIEGYETLVAVSPTAVQAGLLIYQGIVQNLREKYFGYEDSRRDEGQSFLVFHDAVDAFGFALDLQQQLFDAAWSGELLALPPVGDNGSGFRGLRVKVGAYMGNVSTVYSAKTGKTVYQSGESCTIGIAQNLYEMAYGGQILTTFDTWNVASFLAETKLFSPQVVDLGSHVIRKGKNTHDGVISERIVQLVPAPLAIDFSEVAKLGESCASMDFSAMDFSVDGSTASSARLSSTVGLGLWGRQFPAIKSEKKLSPAFYDAPGFDASRGNAKVTISFIGTSEIEKHHKDAALIVSRVIGLASSALSGTSGYQCQNNMLAFPNPRAAINFGLSFFELLAQQEPLQGGVCLSKLVTYGCVHDFYIAMEPHKTTGRADYFGKVVNRAARVAYTSTLGTICVGETVTPGFNKDAFDVQDNNIVVKFVDFRKLKGVDGEVAVFECKRIKSMGGLVLQQ